MDKTRVERWWRYVVLRGDGIPADLDGRWYDLDELPPDRPWIGPYTGPTATLEPNQQVGAAR